ncbi:hypothetical protein GCM10022198_21880 [Klugiella xanthotipulae]|nr:tyrosine-protein phosphatase [Klugiella xanthotipulae]
MTDVARRSISIDGLYNLRDIGGLRASGTSTRWGTLYRSDGLHHLTETGREQLARLGIRTVIDLRDDEERTVAPSRTGGLTFATVSSPIFQGVGSVLSGPNITLIEFYRALIDGFAEEYAAAVRLLSQAQNAPVLVHCTAGKDRTGIVIALALAAAGVDRDDIIDDYSLTQDNLAGEWLDRHLAMVTRMGLPITPALRALVGESPRRVIADTLAHVEVTCGSAANYLLSGGLTEDELATLRRVILNDPL